MLKQLYELGKQLLSLTRDTQDNKAQIKELQQQMELLTGVVQRMEFERRRGQENDAHEREKLALRVENAMLQFERRLLAGGQGKSNEDSLE